MDYYETRLSPFGLGTSREVWQKHISNPYDLRQVAAKHDRDLFKRDVSSFSTFFFWHPEDEQLLTRLVSHRSRKGDTVMDVARMAGISVYGVKRLLWSLKMDVADPFSKLVKRVGQSKLQFAPVKRSVAKSKPGMSVLTKRTPFDDEKGVDVCYPEEAMEIDPVAPNPWDSFVGGVSRARGFTRRYRWPRKFRK